MYLVDEAAGQCYSLEVLRGYMKFCQTHSIHLISDEIYGLSVFDSGDSAAIPFTSVLSIDSAGLIDPDYLHVFYGMSKVGKRIDTTWLLADPGKGLWSRGTQIGLPHHTQRRALASL